MRATSLFAGLAIFTAACGGGEKKAETPATSETPAATPEAAAPATTGATHNVDMVQEGTAYKFVPAELTIKSGDVVNFHLKSGVPHNVSFWADSIPAGAQTVLEANMPEQASPLQGKMLTSVGETYTVSFANAPTGEYKFYCLPHIAFAMFGKITVQ